MPKIYLVRHGCAAAGWGETADPGLSVEGRRQADRVAETLGRLPSMAVISSPMARARETAAPLSGLWRRTPRIDPRFSEIPTPATAGTDRKAWIRETLSKNWDGLAPDLRSWRRDLIEAACTLTSDCVVFTHFVAINALVGEAAGDKRLLVFLPDNASITVLATDGSALELVEKGSEAPSLVG